MKGEKRREMKGKLREGKNGIEEKEEEKLLGFFLLLFFKLEDMSQTLPKIGKTIVAILLCLIISILYLFYLLLVHGTMCVYF